MKVFTLLLLGLVACQASPQGLKENEAQNSCPMPPPHVCQAASGAEWEVHFSPKGGVTDFLVQNINNANESILIQAYSFTSAPIADALIAKSKQGIAVGVIMDKSDVTGKGTQLSKLVAAGIAVYIDDKHAIAHNKIVIIDTKIVFTGSFNFTNAAENSNAENSIKLTDVSLAKKYLDYWMLHRAHSKLQK